MNKYLYVYTTKTYQKKGWIKVGESKNPIKRIRASKTGTPEALIPLIKPILLPSNLTDKDIHRELENRSINRIQEGGGQEWFDATANEVMRAYHFLTKKSYRAKNFKLRDVQKKAVEKTVKWFSKGFSEKTYRTATHKNRFLLNAKMRFGKCFVGIKIAEKIKAKGRQVLITKERRQNKCHTQDESRPLGIGL